MLQEKYLPNPDHAIVDRIDVQVPVKVAAARLVSADFRNSWIIRLLFRLRGLPVHKVLSLEQLENSMFVRLEQVENHEIILGIIGKPWTAGGGLIKFLSHEFLGFEKPGFAKATWSFSVEPSANGSRLVTETRIKLTSKDAARRFGAYWFFIRPFSKLIRREILRSLKRSCEAVSTTSP